MRKKAKLQWAPRSTHRKWLKSDAAALFVIATLGSYYLLQETGLGVDVGVLSYFLGGIALGVTAQRDMPFIGMVIMGAGFGAAFTVNADTVTNAGVYGFAFVGILFATAFFTSEQLAHRS